MRFQRYQNGFCLIVRGHRWDYWRPHRWKPLSARSSVEHWWGSVTYTAPGHPF